MNDNHTNNTLWVHLQQHDQESPSSVVFAVILALLSYIANGIITGVIVFSPFLRCNILFLHIINFTVANFLLSVFVVPLSIYAEVHPWNLGHEVCKAWIIVDVLLPFISFLILGLMNIDRLLLLTCSKSFSFINNSLKNVILLILPWIVGVAIVIPLWVEGAHPLPYTEGYCVFSLQDGAAITSSLITYFVPAVVVIIMITMILIYNFKANLRSEHLHSVQSRTSENQNGATSGFMNNQNVVLEKSLSLVTLCLADFFFIAMWFPFQLFTLLMSVCLNCNPPISAAVAFTWLGASTACVLPLVWMSDSSIRHNISRLCRSCCVKEEIEDDSSSRQSFPLMDLSTTKTRTESV